MSSETIPAPATSPSTTGNTASDDGQVTPRKSAFAAFLEPVAPVATTTDDDTDSDAIGDSGDLGEQAAGGSSAEYKSDDGSTDTSSDDSAIKNQKSIPRAFLLAMAQRWAKGGGTANKRLDVQKARAQARQIKTSKTVNGAGLSGLLGGGKSGGSSGAGKGADKGGASKKSGGGGRSGSGNSSGRGNGNGSSGSGARGPSGAGKSTGNTSGRGNSGGGKGSSGAGGGGGNSPKSRNNRGSSDKGLNKPRTKNDSGSGVNKTPKNTKTPGGKTGDRPWRKDQTPNSKTNKGTGGGTASRTKSTKGPDAPNRKRPADLAKDKTPKTKASTDKAGRDDKPKRPWHRTPESPKNTKGPEDLNTPKIPGKPDLKKTDQPKPDASKGPVKPPRKLIDLMKKPKRDPKAPTGDAKTDNKPQPKQPQNPNGASRRTQASREAGYRHGIAIGDKAAQAQAYRDGVKDGVHNRIDNGRREAAAMDAIHARRKKQHEEKTMSTAAPEAPLQIPATRVGNTVHLGPGADRSTMSGGEVRNMKDFQDRLTVKAYSLQWKAEDLKAKKAKIAELAKRATELAEKEKALATGGKSIAAVARSSAAISALNAVADELLVRLMRGIDETNAVKSNTETRYGLLYKAIADSDEQKTTNTLAYFADQGA